MGFFFACHIYGMETLVDIRSGDLVRCFNWQYYGEIALVLELYHDSYLIHFFEDKTEKIIHKSLLSLLARCPRDKIVS
jgi:hypothetical protein